MTKSLKREGRIFIVSAPSGCGKTTLCKRLLEDKINLTPSISVTTRPPRRGEKNGKDYFFVTPKEFIAMIDKKEFLEYEENFGYLYGTLKKTVDAALKKGKNVLLSIDVKGAMNVRRLYPDNSSLIFIMPPSTEALKNRLESRMADTSKAIEDRLKIAKKEISYKDKYDHVIVNDRLEKAYLKLKDIIISEGERYARSSNR